ncbi:MAG: tetratricopeptide repeat protein [Candidatus Latescibacter sp.]|nr:tetratricopeptide repeat protein [Candidatus Latescibacter sp.]
MRSVVCLALFFLFIQPGFSFADKASSYNKKGIKAYDNKQYDESVKQFTEALIQRPDSPELQFNRGTALSLSGKKDEALSELHTAAGGFPAKDLSAAALFNAGNTMFTAGDYQGALEEFKKAVKLDPVSRDIRYNLDLTARKLSREEQKKKEQQGGKQNENQDKNQNQNQQNKDSKDKNNRQSDEQKNKNENRQKDQAQNQEEQKSDQKKSDYQPMTREEAERLLNAMNDEEKKTLSIRNKRLMTPTGQGDDW